VGDDGRDGGQDGRTRTWRLHLVVALADCIPRGTIVGEHTGQCLMTGYLKSKTNEGEAAENKVWSKGMIGNHWELQNGEHLHTTNTAIREVAETFHKLNVQEACLHIKMGICTP
jgi:hypothetical protein